MILLYQAYGIIVLIQMGYSTPYKPNYADFMGIVILKPTLTHAERKFPYSFQSLESNYAIIIFFKGTLCIYDPFFYLSYL